MKLKFKQQQYQIDATGAVVNCFLGQTKGIKQGVGDRILMDHGTLLEKVEIEELFSNKPLEIGNDRLYKNIQEVQKENGLKTSASLGTKDFTIEMETGTGKTYVYTRTIFELNRQYGWSKFIIMVPSIAIREGVNKSLEITSEHFQEIYGKKLRFFIYDSSNKSNLVNIKNFSSSSNIEVIVMNYQAFATTSKESKKIFQKLDSLNSRKPIDLIKRTHPILIIDEPQRFGEKAEKTLSEFNPMFTLRYSATHKVDHHKIYRLDAIDAYNQKLVKKINVKGVEVVGTIGSNSFLFLDRINISTKAFPTAHVKMEIEVKQSTGIKRTLKKIHEGDNLYELSNELEEYRGFVVNQINGLTNTVSFTNGVSIKVGQAIGNVDEKHLRRIQIRETIKSHIEKERVMFSKGIKVLSLFFIDEVAKYRNYDESGNPIPGEYEIMFEEEYNEMIKEQTILDQEYYKYLNRFNVKDIHNGYFSIDKKGRYIDSSEGRGSEGSDDTSAYDLIMKDKERLLSFSEPTRFIFSHSALREGWDNPNVFQICTLKMAQAEISKRQEIGRGLRICVNSNGDRMDYNTLEDQFFDYNTLTVVASESYETFAKDIQSEILSSLSDRPRAVTLDVFKGRVLKNENGEKFIIDEINATKLLTYLTIQGYVDENLKVSEKCATDIQEKTFKLPEVFKGFESEIEKVLIDVHTVNNLNLVEDGSSENVNEVDLKPNDNFNKKEFLELWSKINHITTYDVNFDSQELIDHSVSAIDTHLEVNRVIIEIGIGTQADSLSEEKLKESSGLKRLKKQTEITKSILGNTKYDLIGEIAKGTNLTRKTISTILSRINIIKFELYKQNPEDFIRKVTKLINEKKATTLINNIVYSKTSKQFENSIFTINNLKGSLKDNIIQAKKHIYDYVRVDSKGERNFVNDLETGEVLVYAKLPTGFKISTPIGDYNPDWAIVFDREEVKHVYFIAETKGSLDTLELRHKEDLKIQYAKKHFEALGEANIKYDVIRSYGDLIQKVF